jgi:hypothetical protein
MILAALAFAASAPSFDCAKATTDVERMICSNELLAAADRAVAKLYAAVPRSERKNLFGKQKDWLEDRDACVEETCILKSYESRLIDVFIGARQLKTRDFSMKGNPSGTLSLVDVGNGWTAFIAQAVWVGSVPGAVHDTETAGVFKLTKGRASRGPLDDDDCGWKIQQLPGRRWKIEDWPGGEDGAWAACGAVNASIEGIYR